MDSIKLAAGCGSQGIKTDLWLTADKEVLPLTGRKRSVKWKAIRKQRTPKKAVGKKSRAV